MSCASKRRGTQLACRAVVSFFFFADIKHDRLLCGMDTMLHSVWLLPDQGGSVLLKERSVPFWRLGGSKSPRVSMYVPYSGDATSLFFGARLRSVCLCLRTFAVIPYFVDASSLHV